MPRPRSIVPKYRLHKATGQAVVTVRTADGGRKDVYLGRYRSPESRKEYERIIAQLGASAAAAAPSNPAHDVTVAEVLVAFLKHAQRYYAHPDGTPTSEYRDYLCSLRELRKLYEHTPAREFGPLALKTVRSAMIEAGLSRGVVNQRIGRIKRLFKWAVAEELVPVSVFESLRTVAGLRRGRSDARETEPIGPVDLAHVTAVLPFLTPTMRALVETLRHTGMRPQDVCLLRPCDLDRSGQIWIYRPHHHKTAHRGRGRVISIGPRAQAILEPLLANARSDAYLFDPAQAKEERYAARRKARKSKVQPSQVNRAKPAKDRLRHPSKVFNANMVAKTVAKACERAKVPHWHPNQLRHAKATEVRRVYGLEAAQVVLGHAKADVTQVYAERDLELAEAVAAELG